MIRALHSIYGQRQLIGLLTWRDISGRYRASMGGIVWTILLPLLMLAVYTFVFSTIFQARWGGDGDPANFALNLFAGLIVHGIAAEVLNRAPLLIASNPSYVKKVVFPTQVLPLMITLSAVFHAIASLLVLVVFTIIVRQKFDAMALLFPVVMAPYVLLVLGISWLVSAVGVFMRDLAQIAGLVVTLLLFLSPIFYPASAMPAQLQVVMALNPLTVIIEQLRAVVIEGQMPDPVPLLVYTVCAILTAIVGWAVFERLQKEFADVL